MNNTKQKLDWGSILFMSIYHGLLVILTPFYFLSGSFSWVALIGGVCLYILAGLGITAGYHRFFAHRTYQTHPIIEIFYLLLWCLGFAGSAATWSYDHRIHHAKTDTDEDPYSIKKWFWYAHMGWFLLERPAMNPTKIPDLWASKWVRFQHNNYRFIALNLNLIIVFSVAMLTNWFSSFYFCFLAWMFVFHHSMFFINSLAHTWGSRTYVAELTAVDNFILAFLTFGEGYHNYHHAFPNDYRNGISWYHFDPTKWLIWTLEKLHLAKNLRSKDGLIVRTNLIQKDLKMVIQTLAHKLPDVNAREHILTKFRSVAADFEKKVDELHRQLHIYRELLADKKSEAHARLKKIECLNIQKELQKSWKLWRDMVRGFDRQYVLIEH